MSLCSILFWIATLFLCVCDALSCYYPVMHYPIIILPHYYYYCYYYSISNGKLQIHFISIDAMFVMYRGCLTVTGAANVNCMFFSPSTRKFSPLARLVHSYFKACLYPPPLLWLPDKFPVTSVWRGRNFAVLVLQIVQHVSETCRLISRLSL
jgi:hypothetical protein